MVVGEHGPEPPHRGGRELDPQLGEVALQVRPDELLPPERARGLGRGQEGEREAAAQPQRVGLILADLVQGQALELVEGDAAGERLRALAQQLGRGAPQDQEARRQAFPIRQHPQHREDLRPELDLVQDHQPAEILQGEQGIFQASQVAGVLQVEMGHLAREARGERPGQGGLAHLASADQAHDGKLAEEAREGA